MKTQDELKALLSHAKGMEEMQRVVNDYNKEIDADVQKGALSLVKMLLDGFPNPEGWKDAGEFYKKVLPCVRDDFHQSGQGYASLDANGQVSFGFSGNYQEVLNDLCKQSDLEGVEISFLGGCICAVVKQSCLKEQDDQCTEVVHCSLKANAISFEHEQRITDAIFWEKSGTFFSSIFAVLLMLAGLGIVVGVGIFIWQVATA